MTFATKSEKFKISSKNMRMKLTFITLLNVKYTVGSLIHISLN